MAASGRAPLFASTELAARVERAECRMLADAAASVGRRPGADVLTRPLGGGLACFAGPGSPLNKVAGLGFAGPVAPEELAALEEALASRGSPVQVELSTLADPSFAPLLTSRGYALVGFENVLGLGLPAGIGASAGSGIEIRRSGDDELPIWLDVVVTGFAAPDAQGVPSHESFPREVVERAMGDMAGAAGFVRYLARRGAEPAGGASLRLFEGVAQLCGAATLPAHRRHGVQSALLARRLEDASDAGCDVAIVTTQPGSKSQQNVQRQGFELLYTRAVLVREAA